MKERKKNMFRFLYGKYSNITTQIIAVYSGARRAKHAEQCGSIEGVLQR